MERQAATAMHLFQSSGFPLLQKQITPRRVEKVRECQRCMVTEVIAWLHEMRRCLAEAENPVACWSLEKTALQMKGLPPVTAIVVPEV